MGYIAQLLVFQNSKNHNRHYDGESEEHTVAAISAILRGLDPQNAGTEHGSLLELPKSRIDHPYFADNWTIFPRDIGGRCIIWNLVTRIRHYSLSS